jgi:hypothetical protein
MRLAMTELNQKKREFGLRSPTSDQSQDPKVVFSKKKDPKVVMSKLEKR